MKEFLSQKGVPFMERNIHTDEGAEEELEELMGHVSVPVTVFSPYEVIKGFEPKRLEEQLSKEGYLEGDSTN